MNIFLDKTRFKAILIFIAIIIILVALFLIYIVTKPNVENTNSLYVDYSKRSGYVIRQVDETLLNNYFSGKNMLVLFWASGCTYCGTEENAINQLMLDNPGKEIVIVSHDKTKEDLEAYLKTNNLNWFVIFDPERTIRTNLDPTADSIPNAYLLDDKGNIINHHVGAMQYEDFVKFINGEKI